LRDPYHFIATMSWPIFFLCLVVSAIEIICGIVYTAVVTGVIFIRFSKPKAKIVYAERPVVANHDGVPTLMIRIANGRTHMLTDASVRLTALIMESTPEGQQFRRMRNLELTLTHFPLFALTWTLMHKIDEKSPLHGRSAEALHRDGVSMIEPDRAVARSTAAASEEPM
jgi:inward rectifier potassium channel